MNKFFYAVAWYGSCVRIKIRLIDPEQEKETPVRAGHSPPASYRLHDDKLKILAVLEDNNSLAWNLCNNHLSRSQERLGRFYYEDLEWLALEDFAREIWSCARSHK